MSDRFDLEQQIMNCWSIVDDIKLLSELGDRREVSEDELANYLLGLATIYHVKFETMFDTFEKMIASDSLKKAAYKDPSEEKGYTDATYACKCFDETSRKYCKNQNRCTVISAL